MAGTLGAKGSSKPFARLVSAILTDMAVLKDPVVLECGGQFIFKTFPNALHVRSIASRELRADNARQEQSMPHQEALTQVDAQDRAQERLLRSRFKHSSNTPEHYDLTINMGTIDANAAVEIIVEDIVDTGLTLRYLLNVLRERQPKTIGVCTFLDKRTRRLVDIPVNTVALKFPTDLLLGSGWIMTSATGLFPVLGYSKEKSTARKINTKYTKIRERVVLSYI
jgi:hypoxanthine-guanine phosphoribosyltransferase